jgi:endonuclease/exonuclease/phosphatase family metal-dependent hydrolase
MQTLVSSWRKHWLVCSSICLFICYVGSQTANAGGITLRVATYNIDCSDQGIVAPNAGFDTILQGIGQHHLAGNAQPIDILAMQELFDASPNHSTSATLPSVATTFNGIYGGSNYTYDATFDPTSSNSTNGPSGIVYNSQKLTVVSAVALGTPSGTSFPRAPMRYAMHVNGTPSADDFYLYVSHYKASSDATSQNRRDLEAQAIRADADALGPNQHIIFAGDFNMTGGSSEAMYQTLVNMAGDGQAHDPVTSTFSNSAAYAGILTESSRTLSARFDFQLVSGAVLNQPGLQLVPGSYQVFGNNGTTPFNSSTDIAGNTSLSDLPNADIVKGFLNTVSDHLPVVADYVIVPEPSSVFLLFAAAIVIPFWRRRGGPDINPSHF